MPKQLIYTSAPQGLKAGQRGNCTVARSRDLREGLILPLEQLSYYTHLVLPGQTSQLRNPVIHLHRRQKVTGTVYRVLSRIVDSGADHTGRSNHVAHHLIFDENELHGLPSPAVILKEWSGWIDRWDDPPTYIENDPLEELQALGQAGDIPSAKSAEYLAKGWDTTFTTFLQEKDANVAFDWIGVRDEPARARQIVVDLNKDQRSLDKIAVEWSIPPPSDKDIVAAVRQGDLLEKLPKLPSGQQQIILAPGGDETKLLNVFAAALGLRSHQAEQKAIGEKQEKLDSEYDEINKLAASVETRIQEIQERCNGFEPNHRLKCQSGKPSEYYQDCLEKYVTPAGEKGVAAKSKVSVIPDRAREEHDNATKAILAGNFPAVGKNTERKQELLTLQGEVQEELQKLDQGIQIFKKLFDAHGQWEKKRAAAEVEASYKQRTLNRADAHLKPGVSSTPSRPQGGGLVASLLRWVIGLALFAFLVIGVLALVWFAPSLGGGPPVITYQKPSEPGASEFRRGIYFILDEKKQGLYRIIDTEGYRVTKSKSWLELVEHCKTNPTKNELIGVEMTGTRSGGAGYPSVDIYLYLINNNEPEEYGGGDNQDYDYKDIKQIFDKAYKSKKQIDKDALNIQFDSIKKEYAFNDYEKELDDLQNNHKVQKTEELVAEIREDEPVLAQEAPLLEILNKADTFCMEERLKLTNVVEQIKDLKEMEPRPDILIALFDSNKQYKKKDQLIELEDKKELLRDWKDNYERHFVTQGKESDKPSAHDLAPEFGDIAFSELDEALDQWNSDIKNFLDEWENKLAIEMSKFKNNGYNDKTILTPCKRVLVFYFNLMQLRPYFPPDHDKYEIPEELLEFEKKLQDKISVLETKHANAKEENDKQIKERAALETKEREALGNANQKYNSLRGKTHEQVRKTYGQPTNFTTWLWIYPNNSYDSPYNHKFDLWVQFQEVRLPVRTNEVSGNRKVIWRRTGVYKVIRFDLKRSTQ